jgi:SAM-dependent methyltransferase
MPIKRFFEHPLTVGKDLDSPQTTQLRKQIIKEKKFLNRIYLEWYSFLLDASRERTASGLLLEIGSGAGFLNEISSEVISSDLFPVEGLKVILDATALPFANKSLKGILMVNVLHHIDDADSFFQEAQRCVKPNGLVAMIEPWLTIWSKLVYRYLHHEPIDDTVTEWVIPTDGPLSGANSAMPWIIFERDKLIFSKKYPLLMRKDIKVMMPIKYLVAGGISLRSMTPNFLFSFWTILENVLSPFSNVIGMFAGIVITIAHEKDK